MTVILSDREPSTSVEVAAPRRRRRADPGSGS